MEDEGFSRVIKSSDGTRYHLPTAEYDRRGELTRSEVLDSAGKAAAQTNKKASILVTELAGRTWRGLNSA